eukprot:Filipodium_phascolosomae@DN2117_c0_g1_i1.p1
MQHQLDIEIQSKSELQNQLDETKKKAEIAPTNSKSESSVQNDSAKLEKYIAELREQLESSKIATNQAQEAATAASREVGELRERINNITHTMEENEKEIPAAIKATQQEQSAMREELNKMKEKIQQIVDNDSSWVTLDCSTDSTA